MRTNRIVRTVPTAGVNPGAPADDRAATRRIVAQREGFLMRIRICGWALLVILVATPARAGLVISQVYGGGGNSAATYKNDFIELFNNSNVSISLVGDSVQYAATT